MLAPRCGQMSVMAATLPSVSRKKAISSPSIFQ